jgi:hypothetical protein
VAVLRKNMEHTFIFESATYLSPEKALRILSELAKVCGVDVWLLTSQTGEEKSRAVTYDIAGIKSAYAENCRTHGNTRSEMVSFISKDQRICGSINARMYLQKNWIDAARKYGLVLNQLSFEVTATEILDTKLVEAYHSILECVCRNVTVVHASVRSLESRYPKRRKGALGIASALTGVYWMNFFGNPIVRKIDITKLQTAFEISNIDGGCIASFLGSEQSLCQAGDEFIVLMGNENFWPPDKTKSGRVGLFSFLGELAIDQIRARSELVRFELDLSDMISSDNL